MTRNQARAAYRRSSLRSSRYQDLFCLKPTGLSVGYPSQTLLRALSSSDRKKLAGRAVWALTANSHYAVGAIRPGAKVASAKRALTAARVVRVGRVSWYFLPERAATVVVQIRAGVVREVGIATKQLTQTAKADSLLARSLS